MLYIRFPEFIHFIADDSLFCLTNILFSPFPALGNYCSLFLWVQLLGKYCLMSFVDHFCAWLISFSIKFIHIVTNGKISFSKTNNILIWYSMIHGCHNVFIHLSMEDDLFEVGI
jgi:hypothetical protein